MGEYDIEWYSTMGGKEVVAKEMQKLLTGRQMAHVMRQLGRVQEHGRRVGNNYFGKVKTSKMGLEELQLSADKAEVRFLFAVQPPRTLLLLTCYKEQAGNIPQNKIETAESRLTEWRSRS